jgi:hypothetical protein
MMNLFYCLLASDHNTLSSDRNKTKLSAWFRAWGATALVMCMVMLAGCESDPLLSPQDNEDQEDTGSYGKSTLHRDPAALPSQVNPELF